MSALRPAVETRLLATLLASQKVTAWELRRSISKTGASALRLFAAELRATTLNAKGREEAWGHLRELALDPHLRQQALACLRNLANHARLQAEATESLNSVLAALAKKARSGG